VVSAAGNITGGNLSGTNIVGTLTTAAQTNITSVGTLGSLAVTANVTGGNLLTGGLISSTGNITGGNVISGGVRVFKWTTQANTAPTNAVPGDAWYDSYAGKYYLYINDGTGNQWVDQSPPTSFANLTVSGTLSAAGNITGSYFIGNGSQLTGVATGTPTKIVNGTSEANISTSGGNANISISGTSNVFVVASTGIYTTGLSSVTGNITGGNILTAGIMSSTGNATHGNLTVSTGTVTLGNIVNANGNAVGNIGSSSAYFNTIFGKATTAQYADLAELYVADRAYSSGTVLDFGGTNEVTISSQANSARIAGVVSTNPAHLMNSTLEAENIVALALQGRVPTSVTGTVRKGDMMVSAGNGMSRASAAPAMGTVIGKALEDFDGVSGMIEIVVGRL